MVLYNSTAPICGDSKKKIYDLGVVLKVANGVKCDGGKEVNFFLLK